MTTNAPMPPMTITASTSRRINFEAEEEEDAVESGVEDAALLESESAEALLVELLFAVELAVEEAVALLFVLPSTLSEVVTSVQVTVPVDLSIVPPLSAEVGTKPPANFAVTFWILSIAMVFDSFLNASSLWDVKVNLLPEVVRSSLTLLPEIFWVTSQIVDEPSVRKVGVTVPRRALSHVSLVIRTPSTSIVLIV
jgi:hypothetical protein